MVPENIHTPPTEGIGNSGEEEEVLKSQKFKAMYEAKLEFPEGWGVTGQIPSVGGGGGGGKDIFWNHTMCHCLLHNFFFLKTRKSGSVG